MDKNAVSPMQWVGKSVSPLYQWILSRLGQGAKYTGGKLPAWGKPELANQMGGKLEGAATGIGKTLEGGTAGDAEALKRLGQIGGWTTAAVGIPAALGAASLVGSHRRKKDEARIQELVDQMSSGNLKTSAHQKAFEEGFLARCTEMQLNTKSVADLLEKGAERKDAVGDNCKQLIDRLCSL